MTQKLRFLHKWWSLYRSGLQQRELAQRTTVLTVGDAGRIRYHSIDGLIPSPRVLLRMGNQNCGTFSLVEAAYGYPLGIGISAIQMRLVCGPGGETNCLTIATSAVTRKPRWYYWAEFYGTRGKPPRIPWSEFETGALHILVCRAFSCFCSN